MSATPSIRLSSGIRIGKGHPCFVVAEVGINHQGDMDMAKQMVVAAAQAGANAVKFQKRHPESMLTACGLAAPYTGPNSFGATYGEHRHALEFSVKQLRELKRLSQELGMVFFASVWDSVSLRQMDQDLGMEVIKICSGDMVNVPLLRQAGATGTPVILSTGMSTLAEIDLAVDTLRAFHDRIVILHCNSTYPAKEEEIALPVMELLEARYGLCTGYSGHEQGLGPSIAAATMGACVVERHFTLDKGLRGSDHKASLEPSQFSDMVAMIREVEKSMKVKRKVVSQGEQAMAKKLRKSIVAARDLPAGKVLEPGDLATKSPGTGISPAQWDEVVGSTLLGRVNKDDMLSWDTMRRHAVEEDAHIIYEE